MADRIDINVLWFAETAEAYVEQLVAETIGPDAMIDVVYGPPDDEGLVAIIGEARIN